MKHPEWFDNDNSINKEGELLEELPYGQLMIGIDVAVAYCPECGEMIQLSKWDELQTLPNGSKGVQCWCYNCDTDFYAEK